jgi:tetratricopeptide (TPR) repeat protein
MTGPGDTLTSMLVPTQMPTRRPPPGILAERTRPDGPSAQVTTVGPTAPAAPRLLVTSGPRKGAEFVLLESLATVGRGSGNAVAIADLSVSRRHSRLEKRGSRWVVCDQGSGNGTRVNGRAVHRRSLRHGDEIALGDTCLRFLEPEGVIAWSDAPAGSGWRRKAHLYGATVVALGIVLGAGVVRQRRLREAVEAAERAQVLREAARSHFQRGLALGGQGKRAEARDELAVAVELDPGNPQFARALQSAATDAAPAGAAAASPGVAPGASPPAIAPGAGGGTPSVVEAYLAGDVSLALRRARTVGGREGNRLASLLERFEAAFRAGMDEADPAVALRALEHAADVGKAIARGREGRPGREVAKALAARHLSLARGLPAAAALPDAAAHLRAAVRSDPANGDARAELARLAARAREIYLRAYLAKDGDDLAAARRGFSLVARALPPPDETGERARRWLAKLDGKAVR